MISVMMRMGVAFSDPIDAASYVLVDAAAMSALVLACSLALSS